MPLIRTQRVWMRQLFSNLIGNGLKFNVSLITRVEVTCEEHPSEYVFSVMDNGIGIDERHQERIFILFQRIHTQDEYPGTGAGLAISKKIVESFGGRIWVEIQLGSGSTFYFTFPKEKTGDNIISEFLLEIDQRMIQVQEEPTTFIE